MTAELEYFFAMLAYGMGMAVCYHILMLLRALIWHPTFVTDAEDVLFLMGAGALFFLVAYEKNFGILRWYAFVGAGTGCLVYFRILGKPLELVRKWLLQKHGKAFKIKPKFSRKGQVSVDESSSPEHGKKRKKKERS